MASTVVGAVMLKPPLAAICPLAPLLVAVRLKAVLAAQGERSVDAQRAADTVVTGSDATAGAVTVPVIAPRRAGWTTW